MGRPMKTGPSAEPTWYTVDQIVVSVGPYMFQTDRLLLTNSLANSRGRASPPHRILRSLLPSHPASTSERQVMGVACMNVAPDVASFSRNRGPSPAVSRL